MTTTADATDESRTRHDSMRDGPKKKEGENL
uniref:Uncharacterized protein n=1 Tax=Arundo donax TaxID=35708 RepID=A0A0A9DZ09_ARUDO